MVTRKILVTGATGNQGGAVVNTLLNTGIEIHALTRNPDSKAAKILAKKNIKLIKGNMGDIQSLNAIEGSYDFIFFVTDFWAGKEQEIQYGLNLITSFKNRCGHFIFSSTPSSVEEGVFSFSDSKYKIEQLLKQTDLTYSIIRPGLFMELFKNIKFAPPIILGMMVKNIDPNKKLPFVSLTDIGRIVKKIVDDKASYINSDFNLISQYISLNEIKKLYKEVKGRYPVSFALPDFIFKKVVGAELYDLWNWLNTKTNEYDSTEYHKIIPNRIDFKSFLCQSKLLI